MMMMMDFVFNVFHGENWSSAWIQSDCTVPEMELVPNACKRADLTRFHAQFLPPSLTPHSAWLACWLRSSLNEQQYSTSSVSVIQVHTAISQASPTCVINLALRPSPSLSYRHRRVTTSIPLPGLVQPSSGDASRQNTGGRNVRPTQTRDLHERTLLMDKSTS